MASMRFCKLCTVAMTALLVLAAGASSALLSVNVVDVTFVNQLTESLNVTIAAVAFGTPDSITLAPGATGQLAVDVLAALLVRDVLQFRVNNALLIDTGSGATGALGRLLKIAVSAGPCASGQAGLTLMDYAAGVLFNNAGCAELRQ